MKRKMMIKCQTLCIFTRLDECSSFDFLRSFNFTCFNNAILQWVSIEQCKNVAENWKQFLNEDTVLLSHSNLVPQRSKFGRRSSV